MEVLENRIEKRRANFDFYKKTLGDLPGISFLNEPEGAFSNRWLSCICIDPKESDGTDRERIRLTLEEDNIESRPLWKPMHLQPVFSTYPAWLNGISERLFDQGLCLPSGSNLSDIDLQRVAEKVRSCFSLS
jgi:dTDP-4-amino-4,6-dideoxygalactose transaminase